MVRTTEGEIFNHALYPYFEQITASRPEQEFARWLDDKMEYVEWWYKNGDEGKQHFAVPYTDSSSRKRCFYVDFIVRLKSGVLIKDERTSNWYYPGGIIENTDNIDGWSALHLETL